MSASSPTPESTIDSVEIDNAIFATAMEITDPAQRGEFLDRIYRDDPDGRSGMEKLVEMAGISSAFFLEGSMDRAELAQQVIEQLPDEDFQEAGEGTSLEEKEGTKVGRYTLLRKIGEGGCGEIFEAAQEGMIRPVALKIIRRGMDTDSVVSRFEAERCALEIMDHPNIARVQDAGRTPTGRPYFVMELVRGPTITTFCENERLGVRQRLELFLMVCQAIQHAHQKGIVHRDIKPSNILVESLDGTFVPKVIDFGIAKAMQPNLPGREEVTHFDHFMGTPAYMSPEQVDMGGMDIDTRADIYSLGALLYELLAGVPPFDSKMLLSHGVTEMRRILLEETPPLPSEAARALGDRWSASVRGDLDWIIFKAMEKERNRRYLTVNSLSMDLRRYLKNEPVLARKPSRRYLMSKFFHRNRLACLLGAAVLLSLIGGLGTATVMYLGEKDALAEQARLKQQAQARANVSRAAILLSEGNAEEADRLLRKDPLESIDASPEAAEVFRSLGHWNAVLGRWQQAANCFRLMIEANRLGDPDRAVEKIDFLMTGPALLEAGDRAGYLEFRDEVMDRYLPAKNSMQAEHLLKVCLLVPVDRKTVDRLETTAEVCRARIPTKEGMDSFPEWNALSLAFFHYRRGEFREAIREAQTCLGFHDQAGSRASAARCLLAMSHDRLGDHEEARRFLDEARSALEQVESLIDESGFPPIGTWFSWATTRILIREAEAQMR